MGAQRLKRFGGVLVMGLILANSAGACASPDLGTLDDDRISHADVVVPMAFPILSGSLGADSFLASRDAGARRHHGQDLFAPKMRQLVAVFDGAVYFSTGQGTSGNTLTIFGDNGWIACYRHINNDTPGTDDGMGSDRYAFSPGIRNGGRVKAGQLVGYVGDSGNAEGTSPHLHFELCDRTSGGTINPAHSLRAAKRARKPIPADKEEPVIGPGDLHVFDGSLDLHSGEISLIGAVLSVDLDEGEIVMEVSCVSIREHELTGLNPKRNKIVRLYSNTIVRDQDDAGIGFTLKDLRPAQRITAVGRDFGAGSILPARVIGIARSL